jgi:hypothetical protein
MLVVKEIEVPYSDRHPSSLLHLVHLNLSLQCITLFLALSSPFVLSQRYFVLSESAAEFCVLRIFYKAVDSSWGTVPLKLKASIPIAAIQTATFNANKVKKGKQFKVVFNRNGKPTTGGGGTGSGYVSAQSSDAGGSDNGADEKVMSLKAESVKERLLWVALIEKALAVYRQDY